jgi:hypothetical protein
MEHLLDDVNRMLRNIPICNKKRIKLSTLYSWTYKYGDTFRDNITYDEATAFISSCILDGLSKIPDYEVKYSRDDRIEKVVMKKPTIKISYKQYLRGLQANLGVDRFNKIIQKNKRLYDYYKKSAPIPTVIKVEPKKSSEDKK